MTTSQPLLVNSEEYMIQTVRRLLAQPPIRKDEVILISIDKPAMKTKKVLLVDDNKSVTRTLSRILARRLPAKPWKSTVLNSLQIV